MIDIRKLPAHQHLERNDVDDTVAHDEDPGDPALAAASEAMATPPGQESKSMLVDLAERYKRPLTASKDAPAPAPAAPAPAPVPWDKRWTLPLTSRP